MSLVKEKYEQLLTLSKNVMAELERRDAEKNDPSILPKDYAPNPFPMIELDHFLEHEAELPPGVPLVEWSIPEMVAMREALSRTRIIDVPDDEVSDLRKAYLKLKGILG